MKGYLSKLRNIFSRIILLDWKNLSVAWYYSFDSKGNDWTYGGLDRNEGKIEGKFWGIIPFRRDRDRAF